MKLALLTDLHANREAVEAVLAHSIEQGVQRYAFLGDYVGYGADPGWVVDLVREMANAGAVVIKGNHDAAVAQGPSRHMTPFAREVAAWTARQLDDSQLAFLDKLPLTRQHDSRFFVHANAYSPSEWDYIAGRAEAVRSLQATSCRITFCGHRHEPALFHLTTSGRGGETPPKPGIAMPLTPRRRWLAIPGSCGQPRDGNPDACYAVFDSTAATITYHRVAYDHEKAAARITAAGLPRRLAERLTAGA